MTVAQHTNDITRLKRKRTQHAQHSDSGGDGINRNGVEGVEPHSEELLNAIHDEAQRGRWSSVVHARRDHNTRTPHGWPTHHGKAPSATRTCSTTCEAVPATT